MALMQERFAHHTLLGLAAGGLILGTVAHVQAADEGGLGGRGRDEPFPDHRAGRLRVPIVRQGSHFCEVKLNCGNAMQLASQNAWHNSEAIAVGLRALRVWTVSVI